MRWGRPRHRPAALDEDRLVWIMGSSRSGSTWLLRMLGELGGTVVVDDPHLGHHLGLWRPIPLAWAAAAEPPELTRLDELKREKAGYFFADRFAQTWRPLLRELIAGRFAAQARESGADPAHIVVKEPGSQAAELLLSLFPRSRLIFLLRDGRDVVDSWLAAYRDGTWAQDEGAFPLAPHGREAFIRWQAAVWAYRAEAVGRAFAAHDPARRVLVRYEDLLGEPVAELDRVCHAAGIRASERHLRDAVAEHAFNDLPADRKGDVHAIRAASPGGWRRAMTDRERDAMLAEMGEALRRFGYLADDEAVPRRAA